MPGRLEGATALITGSTSGIGRAIAEAYAAEGATVIVSGRREALGVEVVEGIAGSGGSATFVGADLSGDITDFAQTALDAAGGCIDILVNNAACMPWPSPTGEVSAEMIDAALAVNVRAPFLLTGILAPLMAARGEGVVINMGSVNASTGLAGSALYSLTKAANHSTTQSWSAEFGRRGVRVNTIAPGPTETENNLANAQHFVPILAKTPSGRLSRLEEVAAAAVFLASVEAANVHGITLPVDGGYSAASRVSE